MVRIKNIFFLITLLALSGICSGQNMSGMFRNYRSLTVESGLPSNSISCFERDAEGYMWIGTSNGLVRYDGSQVVVFQNNPADSASISGNVISALKLEGDSILWVGTMTNGLNKLNLKTQRFQHFVPEQGRPSSIPSREIFALEHDSNGDLWIGYNRDGFGRYNPENNAFEQVKIASLETSYSNRQNNVIKNFIIDKSDPEKVWVVTLTSLIEFNRITGKLVRHNPYGDDPAVMESRLISFNEGVQASDGSIYIACNRYGVWRFNTADKTWKNYTEISNEPKNRFVNSYNLIEEMRPGHFWLSSPNRGIFILNTETKAITPFLQKEDVGISLPGNINIWRLKSAEGYWIGTPEGVRLYNKQANQFEILSHEVAAEGLSGRQSIVAIFPLSEDAFYCGGYAGEGIYKYNLKTHSKKLIKPPHSLKRSEANMFFLRDIVQINDSTLILLTYDALYQMDLKTEKISEIDTGLKFGKDFYVFNRLLKHSSGDYYISTGYTGVFILDSTFRKRDHLAHDAKNPSGSLVSSSYIYRLCEDPNGEVWIGTEDGFSRYNPLKKEMMNFDNEQRRDSIPLLETLYGIVMAPDSSLWFIDAYSRGVYLEYPYEMPYEFKPIKTGNEGKANRINNLLFSQSGQTIISTATGLSIVEKDGSIRRFTDKEGFPAMPVLAPIAEMPDGRIVVGARAELVSFYPDSLYYTPKKNELHLSSITIFDKVLHTNPDSVMKNGLKLNYLQNFFTINLSLLNFDNPAEYRLSYRLRGFSNEWTTTTDKNAVFTNVPGGEYIFEARLIDQNNKAAMEVFTLPIIMVPLITDTWWFKFLSVSLGIGILISIGVVRFRTIRRKAAFNRELANMEMVSLRAQMNPHFIFNSLNSIRHQIITKKNEEAEKYLIKFSRLVRWILENSESHYITLEDELQALRLYLELESKRFDEKFDYALNIDPAVNTHTLEVPGIIIQPFVENAIWHGLMQKREPGKVSIDLIKTETNLIITITDNGIGREKAKLLQSKTGQTKNSMGVKITTARLDVIQKLYNIKCTAEIDDLIDENGEATGTRVSLTLPLIYNFSKS